MIEKIKAVKHDFSSGSGPSRTVTLGFRDTIENSDYILGVFYMGPYGEEDAETDFVKCERMIDRMVAASQAYEAQI